MSPVKRDIEYSREWSSGWRLACIASIPKEPNEFRQCKKVFFSFRPPKKWGESNLGHAKGGARAKRTRTMVWL